METKKRSIVKSITWRVTGIVILLLIAYLITGNMKETGIITVIFHIIMVTLYYLHERIWIKINWGKEEHPLADIDISKKLSSKEIEEIEEKLREMGHIKVDSSGNN